MHRHASCLVLCAGALGALGACQREPGFDERYASAETAIFATAAAIDSELAARQSEGAQADAASGLTSPSPARSSAPSAAPSSAAPSGRAR